MDDKKIPGKRRRRCNICFHLKYGVVTVINPYHQDVDRYEIEEAICKNCYKILQDDI